MSKVYTRTGDAGMTSLVGGKRVEKTCARLESCIQNRLFVCGAQLATEAESTYTPSSTITSDDVAALEHSIDRASEGLPGWRGFTLPGGCRAAAIAHVCRTVCRRAERRILALDSAEKVSPQLIAYVNRLSDYFYVFALRLNFLQGTEEILWKK